MGGSSTGRIVTGGSSTGATARTLSPFQQQLATDLATVFFNPDEFAVSATYTPLSGVPASISVIVDYGTSDGMKGTDELNTDATIQIMAADVIQVQEGDSVSINGELWIIDFAKLTDDGLIWTAWATRLTR